MEFAPVAIIRWSNFIIRKLAIENGAKMSFWACARDFLFFILFFFIFLLLFYFVGELVLEKKGREEEVVIRPKSRTS